MDLLKLSLLFTVSLVSTNDPLSVLTKSGPVRGYYKMAFHKTIYRAFEGIPYAQPPVGELRFQPPKPVIPWKDEINATGYSEVCIQCHQILGLKASVTGSEDCLTLNVFAPEIRTNASLLPVLFYVHGGAFQYGSSSVFGPGYLLDREIIVVSCNYRLGPMGWLSTEDDVVPGNMALKDQSTALRWVSENIEAFGGNPNRIIISGHSSGAVNAHDHFLSSWSKGLFQGGLILSNTALSSMGLVQGALDKAKKVADLLGCSYENTTIMVSCLMSANASDIVATIPYLLGFDRYPFPYGPVVEKGGDNPFFSTTPIEILSRGEAADVSWITGNVEREGLVDIIFYGLNETIMSYVNDNWDTVGAYVLDFNYTIPKDNHSFVSNLIKEHYLGSNLISTANIQAYTAMITDRRFKTGVAAAARAQAKANKSPVYFYYFTYRGAHSYTEVSGSHQDFGVSHVDDLAYIFEYTKINTSTTVEDIAMREFMLDYWVSYVTNGTPCVGIEWPQLNSSMEELQYLHIMGPNNVSVETSTDYGNESFWSSIKFDENVLEMLNLVSTNDPLSVLTKSGPVRGYYKMAFHKTIYRAFEGIPYAQPPVGELRFQPPKPVIPWKDEINATGYSEVCIQCQPKLGLKATVTGSEDCLTLNVFAPEIRTNASLLPVLFYVHGGSFQYGSSGEFGPGYLLDREIIVVSCNYRLGPMGWLSTEDDVVPGNMGLKDQSTALRWVSENIETFGGNPNRIIMSGHSTGAANAHDHYLSSWSKGLFHGGITMSNAALSTMGLVQGALDKAQKVADLLGCSYENTTIMVSCLMSANATDIVATSPYLLGFNSYPFPYGPVVEKGGDNPFFNTTPIEILSRGEAADVSWMTGNVEKEGLADTIFYGLNETIMSYVNENWDTVGAYILDFNYTIPKDNHSYVSNLIKEHYLGSNSISTANIRAYTGMVTDRRFKTGVAAAARAQAKANKSPVYFYYFTYRGAHSFTELSYSHLDYGVSHCDDMAYVFEYTDINTSTRAEDIAMREFMLDYWVSYATNGTPHVGIEWPQLNSSMEELQYLHIMGPNNVSVETSTDYGNESFWSSIKFDENVLEMPSVKSCTSSNVVLPQFNQISDYYLFILFALIAVFVA